MNDVVWSGDWVAERLGVELSGDGLRELLGLALRRNPKRAHLLVSQVLGKHVPQRPGTVHGAGHGLGKRVRALLGDEQAARSVVLGYAETATGLGHSVADGIGGVTYLHSTRRPVPQAVSVGGFEEEHSHATSHLLLPEDPELLAGDGPLILVDDESSTGRTIRNTIAALHRRYPRTRYVVVALVDMRSAADVAELDKFAAELGARLDVVALAGGRVTLPDDVLERGGRLVAEVSAPGAGPVHSAGPVHPVHPVRVELDWPRDLPDGGRHGFTQQHRNRLDAALPGMATRLATALSTAGAVPDADADAAEGGAGAGAAPPRAPRVLVLGSEELMYAPLRLACALEEQLGASADVHFSTTTRSPVLAVDDPAYAIRTAIAFPAHDHPADGPGERYAYNVAPGADPARRFDAVVAVVDSLGDTPELHAPDGLLARLAPHCDALFLAVVPSYVPAPVPRQRESQPHGPRRPSPLRGLRRPTPLRGPAFSSYEPDDVAWLLQDFSDVELEAPTEEREEAIQSGGAHYAESLPVEYQPSAAYQRLFHSALEDGATRIARAVGAVTETVLAERGPRPVLVSLARAGTPVGVLMRRWAQHTRGLELPHYAISIVRGRGIDTTALRWLAEHHDPADVVFVDGWTGKGAITRELADALAAFDGSNGADGFNGSDRATGFDPGLAVLADPGGCVRTYGTREDFLIPSACLNSTVSGLVSRTVLRAGLVGPDDFHGAKFYRELAGDDVSRLFIDTVAARFDGVRGDAEADAAGIRAADPADRAPTWAGWRAVERISEEYGIGDVNLVKPGVGETTRVLLRRVPWKILARRGAGSDLDHVRLLSEQRGVPVEETDDLPYSCVGLIHPRYTRGATGADGKAVG